MIEKNVEGAHTIACPDGNSSLARNAGWIDGEKIESSRYIG